MSRLASVLAAPALPAHVRSKLLEQITGARRDSGGPSRAEPTRGGGFLAGREAALRMMLARGAAGQEGWRSLRGARPARGVGGDRKGFFSRSAGRPNGRRPDARPAQARGRAVAAARSNVCMSAELVHLSRLPRPFGG
jgi:hypothetical protein